MGTDAMTTDPLTPEQVREALSLGASSCEKVAEVIVAAGGAWDPRPRDILRRVLESGFVEAAMRYEERYRQHRETLGDEWNVQEEHDAQEAVWTAYRRLQGSALARKEKS